MELRADRAGRTPRVPPSLLGLVSPRRGLVLIVPFSVGVSGFMFVIALALQQGAHPGPVPTGLALAPMALVFLFVSLVGPRLIGRFGTRVVPAGSGVQGVGVLLIALAVWRDWPHPGLLALLPGVAAAGSGQALQLPDLMRLVLSEVPSARAGVGGGMLVTTQQSGLALGGGDARDALPDAGAARGDAGGAGGHAPHAGGGDRPDGAAGAAAAAAGGVSGCPRRRRGWRDCGRVRPFGGRAQGPPPLRQGSRKGAWNPS
ncbi:hypothetical protein Shyhy01_15570 [Streptomyces hygroscopicus subsp. hygroscopicus]|nr:hypothetical protein Shyhy01_15570 [Streptomyces hygroscopicus subsp. hygroscopicus]